MPQYDYRCVEGHLSSVVCKRADRKDEHKCHECGLAMLQVFLPTNIVFKGNGFYSTDSRICRTQSEAQD